MNRLTQGIILSGLGVAIAMLVAWADAGPAASQGDEPALRAQAYLRANADRLGLSPQLQDLRLLGVRESLSGQHVRYQQTLSGVPVFGRFLTVSLPRDRRAPLPPLLTGRIRPRATAVPRTPAIAAADAMTVVGRSVPLSPDNLRGAVSSELVYFPLGDERSAEHVLSWQIIAPTIDPLGSWLFIVRADSGQVVFRQNILNLDSGRAFDANPAVTSAGLIPPPDSCDTPTDAATLSSQYADRTLLGINAGQDRLIGEFVDLSAPGIIGGYKPAAVADEPSRNYVYDCNDDRFEEVMVYHHVDALQRKIQSLGFSGASGIIDRPISAHAHYFDDCNAFYDPVSRGIHFGDGDLCSPSTDAAEDADVIIHEYGHAVQDDQVPGWGFGPSSVAGQARAMGEGFGDFLAAAISGDPCLAEWFNIGVTACASSPGLRSLLNGATLNGGTVINLPIWCSNAADVHCSGLVWGGALWDLVQALGGDQAARDTVLTLVLDSQFSLDPHSTFAEAAAAIRQSDGLLYGGAHVVAIDTTFAARGISSTGAVSDFPYAYLRILHPSRGDLDVQLKVGPDVNSPLCTVNVWDPNPADSADDLVGFQDLTGDPCADFLPPSPSVPWHLEVADAFKFLTGTIEQFEIVLSGASRCIATDVPVPVPDKDGFVYSSLDCSTMVSPPGDSDGDTIPDAVDPDDDNDGFLDTSELFVGTDHLQACADTPAANDEAMDRWPADFNDDQVTDIFDIVLLTPPFFGASSAEANYSARKDFNGDGVVDLFDIVQLTPPRFGTSCL